MSRTSENKVPRRLQLETRADYACDLKFPTHWNDNDVYGHINNAVYYEYGGLQFHADAGWQS